MDLLKIHDGKLKITLTADELSHYGLTVASFDYSNVETKRALWHMLDEAKKTVGFDASSASLYVELYPSRTGGCEIFVSKLKEKKEKEKSSERAFCLSFENSEPLITLSAALTLAHYRKPSPLYAYHEKLYLVLYGEWGKEPGIFDLALEFADMEDDATLAVIEKKGQLLTQSAIERLGNMILHS